MIDPKVLKSCAIYIHLYISAYIFKYFNSPLLCLPRLVVGQAGLHLVRVLVQRQRLQEEDKGEEGGHRRRQGGDTSKTRWGEPTSWIQRATREP